jgi:hypothetical protein
MVPRAGMIKRPAGEGRFALHASKVRDRANRGPNDDPVNTGNTIRFGSRAGKGFFPSAATGNGIVAIFNHGLVATGGQTKIK